MASTASRGSHSAMSVLIETNVTECGEKRRHRCPSKSFPLEVDPTTRDPVQCRYPDQFPREPVAAVPRNQCHLGRVEQVWVPVGFGLAPGSPDTVTVDLTSLQGSTPLAVRYAWGNADGPEQGDVLCCSQAHPHDECLPASCPLMVKDDRAVFGGLPANPFLARLVGDKCECPPPQRCDAQW